jgi:2-polyprenyl-6-methoxyphenol hydroxylase-like FAD-dependent oxidoreductase
MSPTTVLISGMGIAGPALAYWLLDYGFAPTIVERAPHPRTQGYIIDFWGAGYDIAEKMGLLPDILRAGYRVRTVRFVDRHGRRVGGFNADVFRNATNGRFTSLPRGELSRILYRSVAGGADILFDNSITALEEAGDGVEVHLEHGSPRQFDVVIGADGLHSVVRALAFGPESRYERFLGYTVAAFESEGYQPRDEDVHVMYSVPGRQVGRFTMRDQRTMFLFIVADDDARSISPHDTAEQKAYLHRRFSGLGWECSQILSALEDRTDLYFDRVSQIHMDSWSKERIALVGDAASAPSLLAGQGSALALIGAYVLAGELAHATRPEDAFTRYEARLRPFMLQKQKAAQDFAGAFAPRTPFGVFLRNQVTKAFALPFVARLAFGSDLLDRIDLPDYSRTRAPN